MRFLYVKLTVKDVYKSIDFYTKLLDMNMVGTVPLEENIIYFLSDEDGQTQIALSADFENPYIKDTKSKLFGCFGFGVDSMKEFEQKLFSMGYGYSRPPFYDEGMGTTIAFIEYPDCNEIEVMED